MRHVRLRRPIAGLWALGLGATAAAVSLGVGPNEARLALFAATLVVEILALVFVLRGRAHLQPSDEGRRTWTLLAAALSARLLAELRVGLLYLDAVPGFIADRPALMDLFVYVLRYLYTLADLLLGPQPVQRADHVGRGVEKRPVEVEEDGGRAGHAGRSLDAPSRRRCIR